MSMRISAALSIVVMVLAAWALPAARAAEAGVDQVLQRLDQVGKNLKEFSAKVRLTESGDLGDQRVHVGSVYFQRKSADDARIHVVFDQRISNGKIFNEKTEYLLDDRWLTDRNYRSHSEVRREVLRPGQKMNLFKLGEGPFPLPIGQSPADVHHESDVASIPPAKDDPKNTAHIRLTPKPGTELARRFKTIDVWVDQTTHMPVRVDTQDKQNQQASTELTDIVLNPPAGLKDGDFQLPAIDKNKWNSTVESLNQ
jgi:outer membrane lipoprotein-sorting protein